MSTFHQILLAGVLAAAAFSSLADDPSPVSLRNVPLPPVPGLLDGANPIVVDKTAAIALGKALFWDQSLGSDGQACASCHFSAGADGRVKNQINPGQNSALPSGQTFDSLPSGMGGSNHTLTAADFPLHRLANPRLNSSQVIYTTDDVVGSAGSFGGEFIGTSPFSGANDQCQRSASEVFNVGHVGTRKITPRNAPTVINAVFNHRNFWDGRANNSFNGSSPWGPRDPDAGVWVKLNAKTVVKQRLNLINSSLASQAVTPPIFNDVEMGCHARTWLDVGRKLLNRQALQSQQVHPQDSVLGVLSAGDLKPGLKTTYKNLVTQAFNAQYWAYSGVGKFGMPANGGSAYNQMEANFAMFFGLAIQLYESTLVSDQSPFDSSPLDADMAPTWTNVTGATPTETANKIASLKHGYDLFISNHCGRCHVGPAASLAAVATNAALLTSTPGFSFGPPATPIAYGPDAFGLGAAAFSGATASASTVTRDFNIFIQPKLMDVGFVNIGVTTIEADPGIDASDPFGNPLSHTAQYVSYLLANNAGVIDLPVENIRACDFLTPLALHNLLADTAYFAADDGLQADGSREGVLRNLNCANPDAAYVPTSAAAQANANGAKLAVATHGAFKVPTLRNVELTGPYMHNGSMATLAQVIEFYARHGNFVNDAQNFNVAAGSGILTSTQNTTDLSNFLKALTDERVRYQKAPFDHPQLTVMHGHVGNDLQVQAGNPLAASLGQDETLTIPAVGADGAATPIAPFLAPAP
ncbi:Cytochrome c551 peroxidase (EC 1.11.1.5) [Methylomonas albis]|uniref:Cytochrome C peroxidase n=1 Tax=Methylomonas albis TaxID=1854563 RepID=A0ABR9CWN4_9GAMM|nr:cytochrome c peroxidase [Methylomonas albis]MBD9355288.1 cytochrome C peroxidase [Methylomonas albis]CAD6878250.1 Cytochrome c551 peroxidase (EC 1.11.1.5) [Methylomonas albis]